MTDNTIQLIHTSLKRYRPDQTWSGTKMVRDKGQSHPKAVKSREFSSLLTKEVRKPLELSALVIKEIVGNLMVTREDVNQIWPPFLILHSVIKFISTLWMNRVEYQTPERKISVRHGVTISQRSRGSKNLFRKNYKWQSSSSESRITSWIYTAQ